METILIAYPLANGHANFRQVTVIDKIKRKHFVLGVAEKGSAIDDLQYFFALWYKDKIKHYDQELITQLFWMWMSFTLSLAEPGVAPYIRNLIYSLIYPVALSNAAGDKEGARRHTELLLDQIERMNQPDILTAELADSETNPNKS